MAFAGLHVFSYSPRPGTEARRLANQVRSGTRQARASRLRELGREQANQFQRGFVGRRMVVLWEGRRMDGCWQGLTDNYLRVTAHAEDDLHNRFASAYLARTEKGRLVGQVTTDNGHAGAQSPEV
jgi:threonylcarbamoyladenosine tRNA methylthiotransferase MtaB